MAALAAPQISPFSQHVLQRTVVLPELRVLFLPVPKAGCTRVLWLLADLAGLHVEHFAGSTLPEVTPALTVHDMSRWRPENRLADYETAERARMLADDGWLRFSIVRHPGRRLWSAWQSKLLLREPRFAERFGDRPWFPRLPERPADLVADFRRFVAALPTGTAEDVHWAVQHDLVGQLPLSHVGRVERLADTLELLRGHVGAGRWPDAGPRENRSPVPMPPHALDDAATAAVLDRHERDFAAYGYQPSTGDGPSQADWEAAVEPLIPLIRDVIAQNARIGELHRVARRVRTAEDRLEALSVRRETRASSPALGNLEGHAEYAVRWAWSEGDVEPGLTAVLRVKDEARSLPWVLGPLLRAVRRVVLVDNRSTDGTVVVAEGIARAMDAERRLELHRYPHAIARCGAEHLATPEPSVHSLAHYYNWSFSHVRTAYALKWDGDMVLTDAAVGILRDLAWQLEGSELIVRVPRYPLYLASDRRAFLDLGLRNCEAWAWPNRPGYSFVKAIDWELPLWPSDIEAITLPDWSCVELKHLDADEFAHWSPTDFAASARTARKRREWEVFHAIAGGRELPDGVAEIEARDDRHVVDYVRCEWLPARASEALGAAA